MKFGFIFPGGDARTAADFAREAESAGWDGFFVWEPVWGVDAWISLTAAAMQTSRIRLGTMISPVSRMRPWKLASETATLDHLSGGRVILSVGLGAIDSGFEAFGEVTDRRTRAELLDEGLEILTGLWRGQPFNYHGKHYNIHETNFAPPPPPVQKPNIPIWVVGAWFKSKSMRRVLKYDGLLASIFDEKKKRIRMSRPSTEEIAQMKEWIHANRTLTTPFDIVIEGQTPGNDHTKATQIAGPYAEAGVTWWTESLWEAKSLEDVLRRIRQGPPQI
jgi:hypothetical protein